ncbi:MAG: hypothetical protein HY223_03295 [Thaumarchaeota archaeon]|nr:hypothetical protein [Nitrososphaerota archaeon]
MTEEILKLQGKEAEAFLEYDSQELTPERKLFLEEARKYYKKHCNA